MGQDRGILAAVVLLRGDVVDSAVPVSGTTGQPGPIA